ncbi:MAG: DEAD/DEAH box helicase [Dehalococcoidia bacterium]|nr:DEAD/DEAH box helicase [Dehalococcoidia bacterium]
MSYTLRPYQERAVQTSVKYLQGPYSSNGIIVLPTGSGKSLVIANIIKELGDPTLVFQPSKEILEQNHAKMESYGFSAGIYSASLGRKQLYPITFATIGSVRKHPEMFKAFRYILIDECHLVNSKGGMYRDFLKACEASRVLGLTATPYRLVTDGFGGSILKFLTRTRPRIFTDVVYYVNNRYLFDSGFLAKLRYINTNGFDRTQLRLNTTGADYDDKTLKSYYKGINFPDHVLNKTRAVLQERRNALVFTRFIEEAEYVASRLPGCAIVTGETPKRERERIISGFRSGEIRAVANVGVLTTGFDYPELETVILARPTMSLALYYQMIGRGIRIHPDKIDTLVVDMCGNVPTFGPIEDLKLVNGGNGKWFVSNQGKQLTNVYFGR